MKLSITDNAIVVSAVFSSPERTYLKSLGGREAGTAAIKFPRLRCYALSLLRSLEDDLAIDETVQSFLDETVLRDVRDLPEELYPIQREGVQFLVGGNRLLQMRPGWGKTATSIIASLAVNAKKVLVVAPLILLPSWRREVDRWDPEATVQIYRDWQEPPDNVKFVVTNYETVVNHPSVFMTKWDVVILDESIKIKNRQTKRFKTLKKIRPYTNKVWLLSGFPTSGTAADLWSQLNFLYPQAFPSYWKFVERYCRLSRTQWGIDILGDRRDIDFKEEFKDVIFFSEDHIDLPEPEIVSLDVELTSNQQRVYEKALDEFLLELRDKDVPIPARLAQITRLSQIVGNLAALGHKSESGKLVALAEMIELDYLRPPIVIWTRFVESQKGVIDLLRSKTSWSIRGISGDSPEDYRDEILSQFRDGKVDVLVMQIDTGKYGLTLIEAQTIVYYELSPSADSLLQSYYRFVRIGLGHTPSMFSLKAVGTVDELFSSRLTDKVKDVSRLSQVDLVNVLTLLKGKAS